jgi:hypothetical protein
MTYDELLAVLDEVTADDLHPVATQTAQALRAVVELHKPFDYSHHFTDKVFIYCSICKNHEYPCPTIQAIEKELT